MYPNIWYGYRRYTKETDLKVNDTVRIRSEPKMIESHPTTYSSELYKIRNIILSDPVTFRLADLDGTRIVGAYYRSELIPATA